MQMSAIKKLAGWLISVGFVALIAGYFLSISSVAGEPQKGLKYIKSHYSNEKYTVDVIKLDSVNLGCSVVEKHSRPLLFVSYLLSGDGSITFVSSEFGLSVDGKNSNVPFRIGKETAILSGSVDGTLITVGLSKKQIERSDEAGLEINKISIDPGALKGMLATAKRCLSDTKDGG